MKSPQRSTFVMTIPPHVCFGYCSAAISSHHSAVTGHVAGKDGRKPSFDPRTHHKNRPDLVATTQVYGAAATMSALGQKRTLAHVRAMSALPPKANIRRHCLLRTANE